MGYYTSNTAYAYDMPAEPAYAPEPRRDQSPRVAERPRFDVVTGQGRAANQQVSPAFMHVLKVFCVLVGLVVAIGLARVTLASVTTARLNANAEISNELSTAQDTSSDLEVMRSVYGSNTRIRDLATETLGMVEPESRVTVDISTPATPAPGAPAAS